MSRGLWVQRFKFHSEPASDQNFLCQPTSKPYFFLDVSNMLAEWQNSADPDLRPDRLFIFPCTIFAQMLQLQYLGLLWNFHVYY